MIRIHKAGLYIHFPFCEKKCPYCHFYSIPFEKNLVDHWLEGIRREAARYAGKNLVLDTVYIGGGTPSLLDWGGLSELLENLGKNLHLSPVEFTIEVNPGLKNTRTLREWRMAGIDRISLGIQSFDDVILRELGRSYTTAQAISFYRYLRDAGFQNINIDLMIGVPGEEKTNPQETLDKVSALQPDHVSLYILENLEGLPLEAVTRMSPVDEDWIADEYLELAHGLKDLGFAHYEISNFAREGKKCLHNMKYWRYGPFLGLGPSACSHLGNLRWSNTENLVAWREALEGKAELITEVIELNPEDSLKEAIVFGLRLVEGIKLSDLKRRFCVDVRTRYGGIIDRLEHDGLLILKGDTMRIPEEKLLISNQILNCFM